jgi:hypothetical protein
VCGKSWGLMRGRSEFLTIQRNACDSGAVDVGSVHTAEADHARRGEPFESALTQVGNGLPYPNRQIY